MTMDTRKQTGPASPGPFLAAPEAARELGISLPTLYAYVSRGLIRSEAAGEQRRARRYHAEDIARLKAGKEARRDPGGAARMSLSWGMPVLDSAITLIADGRLYYRGRDALELAVTRSLEDVAGLIWLDQLESKPLGLFAPPDPRQLRTVMNWRRKVPRLGMIDRFQVLLPIIAAQDLAAFDLRREAVARTAARILQLLTLSIGGDSDSASCSIVDMLERSRAPDKSDAAGLMNAALILCADHELNVSSFTARCVASSAATPYDVALAGLAALKGGRHGGATARVGAFLDELADAKQVRRVIADRLRRGERLPGFGQPLYPNGDPRARILLDEISKVCRRSPAMEMAFCVITEAQRATGEHPNIDFGLTVLTRILNLGAGYPLALFALGRTIGWIGHAIEQYEMGQLIRPRARYVGKMPLTY
jgi:citrate synthase